LGWSAIRYPFLVQGAERPGGMNTLLCERTGRKHYLLIGGGEKEAEGTSAAGGCRQLFPANTGQRISCRT